MREDSIVGDIAGRLATTGTPLVILDRLSERDVVLTRENNVAIPPVSRQIYITADRAASLPDGMYSFHPPTADLR